jgi:Predicted nucleotide-binding protein containing TIR-like domain
MDRNRPSVFLGSSSEGKEFALAVQARLQHDAEVTCWDEGIFTLGLTFIENLMKALPCFDFAVLVLTKDDLVVSRSNESASPRDNVIFELGLFMGELGRDRTFILEQPDCGLKIPSDLMGVTTGRFDWPRSDENYAAAVAVASEDIRKRIRALGKRERPNQAIFAGLDPNLVVDEEGTISTEIAGCEILTIAGRIQDYPTSDQTVVVLPCNEYFDDKCASDSRSALGAYVSSAFAGRVEDFTTHVKSECAKRLGPAVQRQKTNQDCALSYGPGHALLMRGVLGSSVPIALLSTTTQRAGQGLLSKAPFVFEAVCELVTCLADERLNHIVTPILGAGHGGMDSSTAFVILVLALAEAVRSVQSRPLRSATIINFKSDEKSSTEVDPVVVRRALALAAAPRHGKGGR